jgi:integrase
MATITKRKTGWLVQVRRKGYSPRCKTFRTKSEAQTWAREQEGEMDRGGLPRCDRTLKGESLASLLDRYLSEVTPRKLSRDTETQRLRKLQKHAICRLPLRDLRPAHLSAYRDERLAEVKPGTVRRELGLLHHLFDVAVREWGLPLAQNPLKQVALPVLRNARDRRLEAGEGEKLEKALSNTRNEHIAPIVLLAIETGLRRREVLELTWRNVDLARRVAFIPLTKTGVPRTIPLTDRAIAIISELAQPTNDDAETNGQRLFPISTNSFKLAWRRVQERAGLKDLRFHDLRHEALSRFCELGLTVPELAVISGHKDPRMLFRYAHLRADDLARKLAGTSWRRMNTQVAGDEV